MVDQPLDGGRMPESHHVSDASRPWKIAGLFVILSALGIGAILFLRESPQNGNAQTITLPDDKKDEKPPSPLFRNWDKPTLAIAFTGQMYGYLQPCGCSYPQYGGLSRRFNFLKSLRDKGWPLVATDLGDLAPRGGPQALLKYETAMSALGLMKYSGVGVGKNEFYLPLEEALVVPLNNKLAPRILAANLKEDDLVLPWKIVKEDNVTIGLTGVIGPGIIEEGKTKFPKVKFNPNAGKQVLSDLGSHKPDIVMMLYQGSEDEAKECADICAKLRKTNPQIPKVDAILCLEKEEEPSGIAKKQGDTLILGIGHKGRYVGVLGAFRNKDNGPFELKYQLVSIGPEWDTPKGKEKDNPVMVLMEEYAKKVKERNYLTKYPRSKHPVQLGFENAKYIGSEACGNCHAHAYKIWEDKGNPNPKALAHSRAFKSLEEAKYPSLRQFDGECVSCHVVGFQHNTGYADPANNERINLKLLNVGCESCHGPGSDHANNPNDPKIKALINPFKAKPGEGAAAKQLRFNQMDHFCQKCHDIDNDVNWGKVPFNVQWQKIAHPTPKQVQVGGGK